MTGQAQGGGAGGSAGAGQGQGAGGQGGSADAGGGSILSRGSAQGGSSGSADGGAGAGQGQGAAAGASGGAGSSNGDQGQGAGQGQQQQQQQGQAPAWSWAEGVAGQGDRPAWFKGDKFKSVAAQAEAYAGLETKLGPAAELIGAPQDGKYAVPALPQGMDGEVDESDPLLVGFSKVAADMGLSQKAYEKVVQHMRGVIVEQANAENARLSEAISQLGANLPARVSAVQTYVTQHLGAEAFKALDDAIGTNADAFQALEKLIQKAGGDAQLANEGGTGGLGFTKAEVEAERYKVFPEGHQLAGKRMYDHDAAHRQKVDGMWKKLFPGEDRQQVG